MRIQIKKPDIRLFDRGSRQFALVQSEKKLLLVYETFPEYAQADKISDTKESERILLLVACKRLSVSSLIYLGGGYVEVFPNCILICGAKGLRLEVCRHDAESIIMSELHGLEKEYLPICWSLTCPGTPYLVHAQELKLS